MKNNLAKYILKGRGLSWLSPKVYVQYSGIKGRGVFAKSFIKKGEVINICGGAIISQKEYDYLEKKLGDFVSHYAHQVEDGFYLLGGCSPGELEDDDFFNHSCDPTCGIKGQIVLVALRDIKKGEELTYDYCMTDSGGGVYFKCRCGTKHCRGKVTGSDWKRPDLQKRYKGYFAQYIEEKIGGLIH
ncbi:MAG: SET domain-containing protein [Candidatus Omnitrophica bacterium]|jgi:hypothetical protein|nr:SET domain-containing protein [Candidatus Omnitrophota bacterium]